ncbi:MAG: hypothetical protein ACRDVE_20600 [Actinocrinis sp.]
MTMDETTAGMCIACGANWPLPPSLLCGGCYARLRRDLAACEFAYEWLGTTMRALKPAWRTGTITRGGESRPPFDVQLHDARAAIETGLDGWARYIAGLYVPPMAGPADPRVPTVARWLRGRLRWCSDQPWCGEFAVALAELRQAAYALAPWERGMERLPLPCPGRGCGRQSLVFYQGSDTVTCSRRQCGHTMPMSQYRAMIEDWYRQNRGAA